MTIATQNIRCPVAVRLMTKERRKDKSAMVSQILDELFVWLPVKRVLFDRGFCQEDIIQLAEDRGLEYVIAATRHGQIKQAAREIQACVQALAGQAGIKTDDHLALGRWVRQNQLDTFRVECEVKARKILEFSPPAFEVIESVITREIGKLEKSKDIFDYTKFRRLQFLEYNLVISLFRSFKSFKFHNIQNALASYIKSIRTTIFQTYIKTVNLIEMNKKWTYFEYSEDEINQSILSDLNFIPNNKDRMILGHFLTELDKKAGIFITNDHKDFLSRRKRIENKFPNVKIISPVYFCVVWNSISNVK